MSSQPEWQALMAEWAYAYGKTSHRGVIKQTPEDFLVSEKMPVIPIGEGEHDWLLIQKRQQNTEQIAKQLARHAGIAYRDVGYSGLKDRLSVSSQWFSVWLPGKKSDWESFSMPGVQLQQISRHNRKIKRATHKTNCFEIVVRDLQSDPQELQEKLQKIQQQGVPNYFGPQRFGRDAGNLPQALSLFCGERNVRDRHIRSLLLSAARAWLFNSIVSARVENSSWIELQTGEPANLEGSGSVFTAEGGLAEAARLASLDIHPTAPMWGKFDDDTVARFSDLHHWELQQISPFANMAGGLIQQRLKYQRRPLRTKVQNLSWEYGPQQLTLKFELQRGQFATSVLRELIAL